MDEVVETIHAERGFVMLREADPGAGEVELVFRAARGMDQRTIDEPQFQISRSVVERVAREGRPLLTSDAQADSRFNIRESVMLLGLRSILCVPLNAKDQVIGVIYVDSRLQAGIFTQDDLELLTAIASTAAIAIENARLYQIAVEKGRLERELQMARKVQASLLPAEAPEIHGWQFFARWVPARVVAGDYYDFIPVEGGNMRLLVADVTDKGLPAALFMVFSRSIVRASIDWAAAPAEGIAYANQVICAESSHGLFVTVFYALLNPEKGQVTYVNAGHNPGLHYHSQTGSEGLAWLTATGRPLGVDTESEYSQRTIQLEPGDFIFLYTDGITEAPNQHGEEFGVERLQRILLDNRDRPPVEIMESVEQAVAQFTDSPTPFDDITVIIAKRLR
jgi:sigma-B regulation protein RsbU (phosphoserine phosphatase)